MSSQTARQQFNVNSQLRTPADNIFSSGTANDSLRQTTSWKWKPTITLLNGIIFTLWGITLINFVLGIVPYADQALRHSRIADFILVAVASVAASHTQYVISKSVELYTIQTFVSGFTLRQLQRMQDVAEWMLIQPLMPFRRTRKRNYMAIRPIWIIVQIGMQIFHISSLFEILQPSESQ